MKIVFLSSVNEGLKPYRAAVYEAIQRLDGYHCVRMEDFGARDNLSEEVCRQKVAECDICILGQRYGSCPPGSDKSYTEIEYDTAVKENKVCLMFPATEEFPVQANLIETQEERQRLDVFRRRVMSERQVAFFDSESTLTTNVVTAIHNCRNLLPAPTPEKENRRTYLLFPWVMSENTVDTGVVISNTGSDPFGTVGQAGVCTLHYYGTKSKGDPAVPQTSAVVMPGETLKHVFSQNTVGTNFLGSRTGFSLMFSTSLPAAEPVSSDSATDTNATPRRPRAAYVRD